MSSCARPNVVSHEQLTLIGVPVQGLKCDLKSHVCWHAALSALLEVYPLGCECQLVVRYMGCCTDRIEITSRL